MLTHLCPRREFDTLLAHRVKNTLLIVFYCSVLKLSCEFKATGNLALVHHLKAYASEQCCDSQWQVIPNEITQI